MGSRQIMESNKIMIPLMIFVIASILFNDLYNLEKSSIGDFNWKIIIATFLIMIITIVSLFTGHSEIQLYLLGGYIIMVIGYSIFQWYQLSKKSDECGILLPHTSNFDSIPYNFYRTIYLITLMIIVSLLQFKVDVGDFKMPGTGPGEKSLSIHYFLFLIPIILPTLTEVVDTMMNGAKEAGITDRTSNPESLLTNFVFGKTKIPDDMLSIIKISIVPLLFYVALMWQLISSSDKSNNAIYITLFFMIFFSLIMRTIFIQDCSLEDSKDISKTKDSTILDKFECLFEKYGGLQTLLCVSLIISLIYHIKSPIYKILFFTIICLASWGLSTTYILTGQS